MKLLLYSIPLLSAQLATCAQPHFNVYEDPYAFPQYEVTWDLDTPISNDQADRIISTSLPSEDQPPTISTYNVVIKDHERFLCEIPYVEPSNSSQTVNNQTVEDEQKELALATQRGWELLKGMEGQCIYFMSGWWSYSFCYNQAVHQFHQLVPNRHQPNYPPIEDPAVVPFVLGRYDGSEAQDADEIDDEEELKRRKTQKKTDTTTTTTSLGRLEVKGQTRYLVQQLGGGTVCDLTGEERSIEVQFRCDATLTDRITLIKEISTCQYRMVISTPRLCNDVAFHPPKAADPHKIECHPILESAKIPEYLAIREAEAQSVKTRDEEAQDAAGKIAQELMKEFKQVIGFTEDKEREVDTEANQDIIDSALDLLTTPQLRKIGRITIGGNNLVPADVILERGTIVGGEPKETVLGIIARNDGFVMDKKEMKKLRIPTNIGAELDIFRKQMNEMAKGRDWHIMAVETPTGQELRGIVLSSEEDDAGKAKKNDADADDTAHQPEVEDEYEDGSEEQVYKEEL
jgi:protein OS-9